MSALNKLVRQAIRADREVSQHMMRVRIQREYTLLMARLGKSTEQERIILATLEGDLMRWEALRDRIMTAISRPDI